MGDQRTPDEVREIGAAERLRHRGGFRRPTIADSTSELYNQQGPNAESDTFTRPMAGMQDLLVHVGLDNLVATEQTLTHRFEVVA